MKTTSTFVLLLLMLLIPMGVSAQKESANLIKNGDFEKFTGDNPDGWETSNIPGTLTVVSSTKGSNSGARAVKCEVKDFGGSLISGYVCQKNILTEGKDIRLTGFFSMHSEGSDQGVLVLHFVNSSGSMIGSSEEYIDDSAGKFVRFSKDVKALAGCSAVNVRLTILAQKDSGKIHAGSYVVCDDLKLMTLTPAEKPLVQ